MQLIGLHGKAAAGKDTAAAHLFNRFSIECYALAEPIREGLAAMLKHFGVTEQVLNDRAQKERIIRGLEKSPRELMQTLGTEWGREMVHPRLWLMNAERVIGWYGRVFKPWAMCITDIRFPDEAEWLRSQGGEVWHIVRPSAGSVRAHASEADMPSHLIDRTIPNDRTIEDLHLRLNAAVREFRVSRKTKGVN